VGSKDLLRKNILEFYSEAKQSEINKSYNSAATLYFKAIVVAIDYIIFLEKSIIPKNHTQRFEILKKEYPKYYDLLDKDFPLYQKTYSLRAKKEEVEVLKNDARQIIEESGNKI
jgi:hypothetical protein